MGCIASCPKLHENASLLYSPLDSFKITEMNCNVRCLLSLAAIHAATVKVIASKFPTVSVVKLWDLPFGRQSFWGGHFVSRESRANQTWTCYFPIDLTPHVPGVRIHSSPTKLLIECWIDVCLCALCACAILGLPAGNRIGGLQGTSKTHSDQQRSVSKIKIVLVTCIQ